MYVFHCAYVEVGLNPRDHAFKYKLRSSGDSEVHMGYGQIELVSKEGKLRTPYNKISQRKMKY
jgi:hypothetical protein